MILSKDTIIKLKPPYQITETILRLVAQISERLGKVNAIHLQKPPATLRKKNQIKAIQSSLAIEGNTLTEEQITALLNNQRVPAPQKDILEVRNAINVYEQLHAFNPTKLKDLEMAHGILMKGLIDHAGKLRQKNVGIVKASKVKHLAPPGSMVKGADERLISLFKT